MRYVNPQSASSDDIEGVSTYAIASKISAKIDSVKYANASNAGHQSKMMKKSKLLIN